MQVPDPPPPLTSAVAAEYLFRDLGGEFSTRLLSRSVADNFRALLRLAFEARGLLGREERDRFDGALHVLADGPAEAALAREPVAYHWVCLARCLVKEAAGLARDPLLSQYESELSLAPEAFRRKHSLDFVRLALGAAVLSATGDRAADRFVVPLVEPFSWVVPGVGMELVPPGGAVSLGELSAEAIGFLARRQAGPLPGADGWRARRQFGGTAAVPFFVDTQDACMRLRLVEAYPRVDDRVQLRLFEETLRQTHQLLAAYHPGLADEVGRFICRVCPMHTAPRGLLSSGSVSFMFGAVFLSYLTDPVLVAEMLVHEFGHNKLRLLDDAYKLLAGPEGDAYYSPWRDEPRPMDGIMHGLYVFGLVARFWLWVHSTAPSDPEKERSERRLRTLLPQLEYALEEFQTHGRRTPGGEAFLSVMQAEIRDLRTKVPPPSRPGLPPIYVGPIRDEELLHLPAEESVRRHRQLYMERYRGGRRA